MHRQLKSRVQSLSFVEIDLGAKLLQLCKKTENAHPFVHLIDQGVGAAGFLTDEPVVVYVDVGR